MTTKPPRKSYPSDLSDARWALMESTLTAWRTERQKTSLNLGGKVTDLREVLSAILYVNRTGIPWRYLPHDFPPHTTVFSYFSAWTADGTIEKLGVRLHRIVREREGRTAEPTACVIDAQSVKTAPSVPTSTQGTDAGKKIVGRKRSIVTDTLGLLLLVMVTAASVSDNQAGKQLLTQVAANHPTITKAWADTGYKDPGHRTWRRPRHRRRGRAAKHTGQRLLSATAALGGGAKLRLAHDAPPPGPRLRNQTPTLREHDPPRHALQPRQTSNRRNDHNLAHPMN
ncbi:hypothetical protein GCM10010211_85630 [Streptomyces albospinus]|uniref:Transposase n=1 Tax=Streptomyces albospinus TaxID=285515 RepID=A0ABQ2VPR0_9ACTN|nr:hypothetical protein GCM10010211_85630 [Streptomyces albospinus]